MGQTQIKALLDHKDVKFMRALSEEHVKYVVDWMRKLEFSPELADVPNKEEVKRKLAKRRKDKASRGKEIAGVEAQLRAIDAWINQGKKRQGEVEQKRLRREVLRLKIVDTEETGVRGRREETGNALAAAALQSDEEEEEHTDSLEEEEPQVQPPPSWTTDPTSDNLKSDQVM